MLTFTCNTCGTQYEAHISNGGIAYFIDNKRHTLKDENDPCATCLVEIEKAKEEAKENIKKRKLQKSP